MTLDHDATLAQRKNAKRLLYRALRHGELVRPLDCEHCGGRSPNRGLDAHHVNGYDDDNACNVEWLCQACHNKIHGGPKHRGLRHSAETKRIIAESVKKAYAEGRKVAYAPTGVNNPFFGHTHTDEVKQKISEARRRWHQVRNGS